MQQGALFGAADLEVAASSAPRRADLDFAAGRRIDLDATSWVEHHPGWLLAPQQLFTEVRDAASWERRERWMYDRTVLEPRLTAEYPDVRDAPPERLREVADALSRHFATPYTRIWINLYRDHRDSTGWHGDAIGRVQEHSIVPVLSLGAPRRFLIRPRQGGRSISLQLYAGDLVVMGGRAQRDWRHCVPKQTAPAGPRISVNFAPRTGSDISARGQEMRAYPRRGRWVVFQ